MGGKEQKNEGRANKGISAYDSRITESPPQDSFGSTLSSSSSDLMDDVTSSSSSASSPHGPLYELSELMAQLPIKRGLSKYYQGKSQTFASLASVKSLEDLAKSGGSCTRKIKSCRSWGGGLYHKHIIHRPKAIISKQKSYKIFNLSSVPKSRNNTVFISPEIS